jgi:chromosome segregation ATPase
MEERMESSAELVKLEQFVDKLLTKYHELKDNFHALQETLRERDSEIGDLKGQVSERDSEIADLKGQIEELSSERAHVGERVAGLIGRIEEWEAEQDVSLETSAGAGEDAKSDGGEQAGLQGSLFDEAADNS